MKRSNDELARLLRKGDARRIAAFFAGASESERQQFASQVLAWCKLLDLHWRSGFNKKASQELAALEKIEAWYDLVPGAQAAGLACLGFPQLKTVGRTNRVPGEISLAILSDRRPPWVDEYAEWLCEGDLQRWGGPDWKQVRALVRGGICQHPRHENYALGALHGIWPPFNMAENLARKDRGKAPLPEPNLVELLLAERDWLDTGFWRLFEVDGTGEVSLANCEKYNKSTQTWTEALLELSRRNVLPRTRLLDATLSALSRDFIQFRAGWFSRFHDALQPTPAECAERVESYLRLLASSIPPTVACALDALVKADKANPLGAARLIDAIQPVFAARGKAVVKIALDLFDRVATREPAARDPVCLAAASALLNEAAEVQRATLDLIERHGDRQDLDLRARLTEYAGAVAASLRPRLAAFLGNSGLARRAKGLCDPMTTRVPVQRIGRIDSSRAIQTVTDLDDLILLASATLEDPSSPTELERLMDGISRLCDQRPDDFPRRIGPLRKRALTKRDAKGGSWPIHPSLERALAMLFLSWIDRADMFTEEPRKLGAGQNQYAFLFRRLNVLAAHARTGQSLPLLSAPTHLGGWIDPAVLVHRWLAWQESRREPDEHEQVLALLRLAPEERSLALPAAKAVQGEPGQALRFALGADATRGRNAALWLAASRSRQPHGDLPEFERTHPKAGPDAGTAARYSWRAWAEHCEHEGTKWTSLQLELTTEPPPPRSAKDTHLPVLFHGKWEASESGEKCLIRWATQLWPANLEALFARAATRLAISVNYADAMDRDFAPYLEPLSDPDAELRPMACLAMALGLAAQDNALRNHAQEGLISVIQAGHQRLDELGTVMARLLDTGINKLARWAKSLREVARVSAAHTRGAADLVQRALRGDPGKAPRDVSALLELLVELLSEIDVPLTDPNTRDYLAKLASGGKTRRLVAQLLSDHPTPAPPPKPPISSRAAKR